MLSSLCMRGFQKALNSFINIIDCFQKSLNSSITSYVIITGDSNVVINL